MSFTDPQTVTISGVTTSLPRVSVGDNASKYQSGDGLIELLASSSYGKRRRRLLRLNHQKITADPFIPAQNQAVSASVYTVIDHPIIGYTAAELLALYTGFNTQVNASTMALVTKILGGES